MRWHFEDEKPKAGRPFVALLDDGSGADTYMLRDDGETIDGNGDVEDGVSFGNKSCLSCWAYLPPGHRFFGRDQAVLSDISRSQRDKGAE